MQGSTGKQRNPFISNSQSKFHSKSLDAFDSSCINSRLPSVLFTGPNGLYNHRIKLPDYPREIGIGRMSLLRSQDADYITRGTNNMFLKKRKDIPGEIGWTIKYFGRFSPSRSAFRLPDINQVP